MLSDCITIWSTSPYSWYSSWTYTRPAHDEYSSGITKQEAKAPPAMQLVLWREESRSRVLPMRIFMWEESEYNQPLLLSQDCKNFDEL